MFKSVVVKCVWGWGGVVGWKLSSLLSEPSNVFALELTYLCDWILFIFEFQENNIGFCTFFPVFFL